MNRQPVTERPGLLLGHAPRRLAARRSCGGLRREPGRDPAATIAAMLAWMDLEMTGLDPGRHVIVEIATIVTDDDLAIVAEGPDLVISVSEEQLGTMDEVVQKMHADSGLTEAIRASTVTLEEAGTQTLAFLRAHVKDLSKVPLCGNSIGVDRRFLHAYLPELEHALHYRSIDVSTVKELARRWHPGIYAHAPKKQGTHRALDDIRESIAELAYYREHFFTLPEARAAASDTPAGLAAARPTRA
jgi:oligoribonuclease